MLFPITATMSNNTPNASLPASVGTNVGTLKVAINPSDNRELGVLALASGAVGDVNVTVGTGAAAKQATIQIQPVAPALASVSIGAGGGEIAPPAWLVNA